MIRDFLEMMNNGGKLKKNIVLMILCCIIYALAYQLLSKVLYQQEHVLLIYGFAYILTLLASMIPAFLSLRVLHDKRREKQMNLKICILPFLGIQSILYIIMCVLGYASFSLAMSATTGILAYLVNVLLMLACLFYIPVQLFSFLQMEEERNVVKILKKSLITIWKHYQSVFYSCLIVGLLFIGYRYFMQTMFSMQGGVALFDLPMELLNRWYPFLDSVVYLFHALENASLWLPFLFSVIFGICLCNAYIILLYVNACIHDGEIRV